MSVDTALALAIDGESTVRMGRISNTRELVPYVASGSSAGTGRKCGVKDWKVVGLAYGYLSASFPGDDDVSMTLSLDGTNGYSGTAYCEQIDVIFDVEKGRYIENAVHLSRNGALTVGSGVATDATVPNPPCTESLSVKLGGVAQDDVRYMHLMIRCPGKAYVSSSTAAGRQRKRGAIDARLVYRVFNISPSALPTVGTNYLVNVMCTDTLSWELAWMRCASCEHSGDHESDEPVSAEIVMEFNNSEGTILGWIKTPESSPTTKWPFS